MKKIGGHFIGSNALQTSTANQEVIPQGQTLYKFSFMNDQDCTVKVNGGDSIFLRAGQGFATDPTDAFVRSFIIIESGISFNWIGGAV